MKPISEVWVVDEDVSIRWVLDKSLTDAGCLVRQFSSADEALKRIDHELPGVVITDVRRQETSGLELLDILKAKIPQVPVIIMTARTDLESSVPVYRTGAFEYLPKPFDLDEATALVQRALAKQNIELVSNKSEFQHPSEIIGEASAMQHLYRLIGRLSRTSMNVLVSGESGTGKELIARAIHSNSPRSSKPLIALNTAAMPPELLEAELFGYEKSIFASSEREPEGRFQQAEQGTLFLDEIGDMPAVLQNKLLRVLSDNTFYRVGGRRQLVANVRVIAATNLDLEKKVREGSFREDLYHRLNVIRITVPPLRDRRCDIPQLAETFLARAASELKIEPKVLDKMVLSVFHDADWPGNVRQLENVCRWLTVMVHGQRVTIKELPPEIVAGENESKEYLTDSWQNFLQNCVEMSLKKGESDLLSRFQPEFEQVLLETALAFTNGHKQEAAQLLGWGRNTLTRKLKNLDLN